MTRVMSAPIKVWRYRGWCAICVPCNRAIATDAGSWDAAMEAAQRHIDRHRRSGNMSMPALRRVAR